MAYRAEQDLRLDPVTGVLAAVCLVTVTPLAQGAENLASASYPLAAAAGLAFVLRRRSPEATLVIVVAAICGYLFVNEDGGPIFVAPLAALACLGAARPRTSQWLPWTLGSVVTMAVSLLVTMGFSIHEIPVVLLLLAAPRLAADRARATALREAALEQEGARRLVEERLRIAREVHDVVGHGLATIALRAGVADHVMEKDPHEAQASLRAIRQVSTEALADLGSLLDVLRTGADAERAPVPNLGQVPRLVDRMRDAGMAVELEFAGDDGPVGDVVGAAAYRIVQESLTNVARHAGDGARAWVRLARRGKGVDVEVLDDGRGAPAVLPTGRGLVGMRERATALGGSFEAGAGPEGGFRVAASLPGSR